MRIYAKYGAGLIALYLVVFYGTRSGRVLREGSRGSVSIIKAFQGR